LFFTVELSISVLPPGYGYESILRENYEQLAYQCSKNPYTFANYPYYKGKKQAALCRDMTVVSRDSLVCKREGAVRAEGGKACHGV
jgi:hypothetical protein